MGIISSGWGEVDEGKIVEAKEVNKGVNMGVVLVLVATEVRATMTEDIEEEDIEVEVSVWSLHFPQHC